MNSELEAFARKRIKEGLDQLNPEHHRIFRLMYGRNDGKRSVEAALVMPLEDVLAEMSAAKLDWCMQQVSRSIADLSEVSPCKV